MKKTIFIRISALLLALVLCLSAFPQPAKALDLSSFEAYKRQATAVDGEWGDTKFWRSNRYTYPFEFDKTLVSCTGFTLYYEIVEVSKGTLNGNFKFEVYVRNTAGKWTSVETFYLDGYEATVDVRLSDPMSINAVAVVCQKKANFTYTQDLVVYNATYKRTSNNNNNNNNNNSNNSVTTNGKAVSGYWSDSKFVRNGRTTYPFIFYSTINRCTGFTLNYNITEISSGSLDGNFKFAVYVRKTDGNWKYAAEFTMSGYNMTKRITFDPISIDAVAVVCLKNGNYSYSFNMSVTNPTTR